ncbi:MAG: Stp1/IreP family PP2C-type Ser/Thr phosphatase [Bacillota bacterium]|nr:Stp1/IreP family PP2C-type Ser/Thr phosphatase [Bacillota bacterium]
MKAEYLSHVGAVRANNEDAVYCDSKNGVFIVADGVGGKEAGEIASATAVRIVAEATWASQPEDEPAVLLREAFYRANDLLHRKGHEAGRDGMGTTLTAAICSEEKITIVHVGDSRAYLLRGEEITQLTEDHTLVAHLVRDGKISPEEAVDHPRKNILIRAIGQEALVEVNTVESPWEKGDYLLLCSDGLYNLISEQEMLELTMRSTLLSTAVQYMAETAYKRGGYDNISVILVAHD